MPFSMGAPVTFVLIPQDEIAVECHVHLIRLGDPMQRVLLPSPRALALQTLGEREDGADDVAVPRDNVPRDTIPQSVLDLRCEISLSGPGPFFDEQPHGIWAKTIRLHRSGQSRDDRPQLRCGRLRRVFLLMNANCDGERVSTAVTDRHDLVQGVLSGPGRNDRPLI
jgi:hypothetical protein